MDIEARLIYRLLTSGHAEQDKFYTQMLPLGVFKTRQTEMLWLRNFRQQHGSYPSLKLAEKHFKEEMPRTKDPLPAVLQPILDFAMFEQMRDLQIKVKEMLDKQEPVVDAMAVFKQGALSLHGFDLSYADIDYGSSKGSVMRYRELVRLINDPNARLVDFPWPTMNKLCRFLRWGNTVVLASRTSIGKSWFVAYWAEYLANQRGVDVLFITKEMPGEEIEDRFEALRFKLPYDSFAAGTMSGKALRDWRKQRECHKPKGRLIISGDETLEGTGLSHVAQKIEQYKPQVVFVDGAYLLRPEGVAKNASRVDVLSQLSNRLKVMAKATKTIIVPVVQLNRSAEDKSGNTKGGITSIYNADAWAQDADLVITLGGKRGASSRIVSLVKGRNSNVGEFPIEFQINPFPSFKENSALGAMTAGSTIKFKGI